MCCIDIQERWRREGTLCISKLIQIPTGNVWNFLICLLADEYDHEKYYSLFKQAIFSISWHSTLRFCFQRSWDSNIILCEQYLTWFFCQVLASRIKLTQWPLVPDCSRSCLASTLSVTIFVILANLTQTKEHWRGKTIPSLNTSVLNGFHNIGWCIWLGGCD